MNIFDIERQRIEVLQDLVYCSTLRQKLFVISDYFDLLLAMKSPTLFEAYSIEFIETYISALRTYSPMYLDPAITEELLVQLNRLQQMECLSVYHKQFRLIFTSISEKLSSLRDILSGNHCEHSGKLCFPVLEIQSGTSKKIKAGFLETVTIKISKGKTEDKFIIIPLSGSPDEKLTEQISNSWHLALSYVKRHIRRIDKFHEVIIHFDGRLGNYIGYSLGITLTFGFVEELLKYYNAPYLFHIKDNIALTGGVDRNGKILNIADDLIAEKTEVVFFSNITVLVVPFSAVQAAQKKLNDLKKLYPERDLSLSGIPDFNDLINRRNIVNIKKQNPFVRTAKLAVRHRVPSLILLMMIMAVVYNFVLVSDHNPAILVPDGKMVYIKNKFGDVLWTKPLEQTSPSFMRLVDIDNNGTNEILFCAESPGILKNPADFGRIACFNYEGREIWKHIFRDTISSPREVMVPSYDIRIMDIIETSGRKVLLLSTTNAPSYSSAIFKLDLVTGKRLPGTIWHSGHIGQGFLTDIDKDGESDIIACFTNNAWERSGIFGIKIRDWDTQLPSDKEYAFYNRPFEKVLFYILVPNTDYLKHQKMRNNGILNGSVQNISRENSYAFITQEGPEGEDGVHYKLNYDLKNFNIVVGSDFRVRRDSLVARGILSPPLTDTKEYFDLLRSQILYWDGSKFVHRDFLD